jgi:hypothetical protein
LFRPRICDPGIELQDMDDLRESLLPRTEDVTVDVKRGRDDDADEAEIRVIPQEPQEPSEETVVTMPPQDAPVTTTKRSSSKSSSKSNNVITTEGPCVAECCDENRDMLLTLVTLLLFGLGFAEVIISLDAFSSYGNGNVPDCNPDKVKVTLLPWLLIDGVILVGLSTILQDGSKNYKSIQDSVNWFWFLLIAGFSWSFVGMVVFWTDCGDVQPYKVREVTRVTLAIRITGLALVGLASIWESWKNDAKTKPEKESGAAKQFGNFISAALGMAPFS